MFKKLPKAALIVALAFSAVIIGSVAFVATNEVHDVGFVKGSDFNGYENTPATAAVQISPAQAWDQYSDFNKVFGFFFLALFIAGVFYIQKEDLSGIKAVGLFLIPLALSLVFLFGGYAKIFTSKEKKVDQAAFNGWIRSGAVKEARGGYTGTELDNLFK